MKDDYTPIQAKIVGYLITVGGNAQAGSTAEEIIAGIKYGPSAVYRNLKDGIAGVVKCNLYVGKKQMWYSTKESLSTVQTNSVKINNGRDAMPDVTIESVSELFKPEPMSNIEKMLTMELPKPEPTEPESAPIDNRPFISWKIFSDPWRRAHSKAFFESIELGDEKNANDKGNVRWFEVKASMLVDPIMADVYERLMPPEVKGVLLENFEVAAFNNWKDHNPDV